MSNATTAPQPLVNGCNRIIEALELIIWRNQEWLSLMEAHEGPEIIPVMVLVSEEIAFLSDRIKAFSLEESEFAPMRSRRKIAALVKCIDAFIKG